LGRHQWHSFGNTDTYINCNAYYHTNGDCYRHTNSAAYCDAYWNTDRNAVGHSVYHTSSVTDRLTSGPSH
jgi:hypothetical protein